jgi:hypothetical protein
MKAYRLVMAEGGAPASPLHFMDRSDASRYQKILLWPWEGLGYFQPEGQASLALAQARVRVESAALPGVYDPDLDWVVWRKDATLGYVPLLPGRCFDPGSWRAVSDHDLNDPIMAPKVAQARRELDSE